MSKRAAETQKGRPRKKIKREYLYNDVHRDLENGLFSGNYGWDNAAYMAIAEEKAGVDMKKFHSQRKAAEFYIPSLKTLIDDPRTQKNWHRIATFDPYGMTANTPTIAATTAKLNIPELKDLKRDGVVVDEHGSVNTTKVAIYYAWNIPLLA